MKQTITMKGLMSSLSVGVAMPQLFDIIIPKEIWESAATGTGYYNGYKVLLQEANIQHHLADEQFYVLKTRDTFDRQAWLFRCAAGSGVVFERYRGGESDLIVSNCDGIASHIFGGKAFDALSHSYLNALGEFQRTDTDVRISAAHRYAAQQIIKTLREGKLKVPQGQGSEALFRRPIEDGNGHWHEFQFEYTGKQFDHRIPSWDASLFTGVSHDQAGAKPSSLTDAEAMALWDRLMASVRLRVPNKSSR